MSAMRRVRGLPTRTSPRSWNKRKLPLVEVNDEEDKVVNRRCKVAKKAHGTSPASAIKSENSTEDDKVMTHIKARGKRYTDSDGGVDRFTVPDHLVCWDCEFDDYRPVEYTLGFILAKKPVWADPDVSDVDNFSKIKFNCLDGPINRYVRFQPDFSKKFYVLCYVFLCF